MDISAGIQASLAGRYASALFELASEAGTVTAVESDLDSLGRALAESADLRALTTNPEIGRGAQGAAIEAVAGMLGVSELTKRFLGVLAQNRRLAQLGKVVRAFRASAAASRSRRPASFRASRSTSRSRPA